MAKNVSDYLHHFSFGFMEAGRWEESYSAVDGAVILRRRLATYQTTDFNKDLALSLTLLHIVQVKLGYRDDGLEAISEAVALYRVLAEEQSSYTNELAMALHNLSFIQGRRHQLEGGLVAIQEAVDLRRKFVEDASEPSLLKLNLANSLNSLAWFLHNLARDRDALDYALEAVAFQRDIASDEDPTSFLALANYLETLSSCLSGVSQHEEALNVICEAEDLQLGELRNYPMESYQAKAIPNLATILDKKSACLASCNQYENALTAIQEAVKLRRQLVKDRPAAYNPDLAPSLLNLANRLDDRGDHAQGLKYVREAVGLWRQLAEDEPTTFGDAFAKSLDHLALSLSGVGLKNEAADTQQEAQKVRDSLRTEA